MGVTRAMDRLAAILLLGPTGSGKTPLGEVIQERGLWGRRCHHFDFGHHLRAVAAGQQRVPGLTDAEVAFLARVLRSGMLLEDEHFPIARSILRAFLAERQAGQGDWVLLNGLPRHAGQARDVEALLEVQTVIHLCCTPQAVFERIRTDAGGDRGQRADDDEAAIRNKLEIYERRIQPLVDHYRGRGAVVETVAVGAADSPFRVWETLNARRESRAGPGGARAC